MKGALITFEGIEGCGKTTQVRLAEELLVARGLAVAVAREPGGTVIGARIRDILLDPAHAALAPTAELLLYAADRAQHVAERIRPALEQGCIVLCDRFFDSTTAYQCAGRGLDPKTVERLNKMAADGVRPDLTFVLDLPPAESIERVMRVGRLDRIEQEPLAFHERVRQAFLDIARQAPERVTVIDAAQSVEAVAADIARALETWLAKR